MRGLNRRDWLIGGAAIAAAAGGAGLAWRRAAFEREDTSIWTLQFDRPSGAPLSMAPFRGKPLLLNFWATWCPPCIKEMPLLDAFHADSSNGQWQVVGLAVDSIEPVREFLGKRPVSYPIGMAGMAGVDLSRQLGNASGALPFSVIFDSAGHVGARKLGLIHPDELQQWSRDIR